MTEDRSPDDILLETVEKMGKAVAHTQSDFASVRTGRATPALVEKIRVEYYGTEVLLQQLAGFNVPEARLLVIQPYDKNDVRPSKRPFSIPTSASTPRTTARSSAWRSRSSPRSGAGSWSRS